MEEDKVDPVLDPLYRIEAICEIIFNGGTNEEISQYFDAECLTDEFNLGDSRLSNLMPFQCMTTAADNRQLHDESCAILSLKINELDKLKINSNNCNKNIIQIGELINFFAKTTASLSLKQHDVLVSIIGHLGLLADEFVSMGSKIQSLHDEKCRIEETTLILVDRIRYERHSNESKYSELLAESNTNTDTLESLRRQIVTLDASYSELKNNYDEKVRESFVTSTENSSLSSKLEQYESEITFLTMARDAAQSEWTKSEEALHEATRRCQFLESKFDSKCNETDEYRVKCESFEKLCISWQEYCQKSNEELTDARSVIVQLNADKDNTESAKNILRKDFEEYKQKNEELNNQIAKLSEESQEQMLHLQLSNAAREELSVELQDLRQEADAARAITENLRLENAELETKVKIAEANTRNTMSNIAAHVQSGSESLDTPCDGMENQREENNREAEHLEMVARLNATIEILQEEKIVLERDLVDTRNLFESMTDEASYLQDANSKELKKMKSSLDELQQEKRLLEEELRYTNLMSKALADDAVQLQNDDEMNIFDLQKTIQELKAKNSLLEEKSRSVQGQGHPTLSSSVNTEELRYVVSRLEADIAQLERDKSVMEEALLIAESTLDEKMLEFIDTKSVADNLQLERDAMELELNKLKRRNIELEKRLQSDFGAGEVTSEFPLLQLTPFQRESKKPVESDLQLALIEAIREKESLQHRGDVLSKAKEELEEALVLAQQSVHLVEEKMVHLESKAVTDAVYMRGLQDSVDKLENERQSLMERLNNNYSLSGDARESQVTSNESDIVCYLRQSVHDLQQHKARLDAELVGNNEALALAQQNYEAVEEQTRQLQSTVATLEREGLLLKEQLDAASAQSTAEDSELVLFLRQCVDDLQQDKARVEAELVETREALDAEKDNIPYMQRLMSTLIAEKEALVAELNSLKDSGSWTGNMEDDPKAYCHRLLTELSGLKDEKVKVENQLRTALDMMESMSEQARMYQSEEADVILELQTRVQDMQTDKAAIEKQLAEQSQERAAMSQSVHDDSELIQFLRQCIFDLQQDKLRLEEELKECQERDLDELNTLRTCLNTLQSEKVSMQDRLVEVDLLYRSIESLKCDNEEMGKELRATVLVLENMREQTREFQSEESETIVALQANVQQLEREKTSLEVELHVAQSRMESIVERTKDSGKLQTTIVELTKERTKLNEQLVGARSLIETLSEQLDMLDSDDNDIVSSMRERIVLLMSEKVLMQQMLEEAKKEKEANSNSQERRGEEQVVEALQKEKVHLGEQLKGAQMVIEVMSEQLDDLREAVSVLEQEKVTLEDQLAGTEAAMDAMATQMGGESHLPKSIFSSMSTDLIAGRGDDMSNTTTESFNTRNGAFEGSEGSVSRRGADEWLGSGLECSLEWDAKKLSSNSIFI